jgi:hypothetical protein
MKSLTDPQDDGIYTHVMLLVGCVLLDLVSGEVTGVQSSPDTGSGGAANASPYTYCPTCEPL